jgi:hypothetical protein
MALREFVADHTIWDTIVIFWIFSAAVNALPEPTETSSGFYHWIYVFLTVLLGHVSDAVNRRRSPSQVSTTKEKP